VEVERRGGQQFMARRRSCRIEFVRMRFEVSAAGMLETCGVLVRCGWKEEKTHARIKFIAIVERSKLFVDVSGDLNWLGISGSGFERTGWILLLGNATGGLALEALLGKLNISGELKMASVSGPKVPAGLMCRQLASMNSSKLVLTKEQGKLPWGH